MSIAAPAFAQDVTGRLEGLIRAADATSISDARVILTSPALPGLRTVSSDDAGRFRIAALPVGTYRVRIQRLGFVAVVIDSVEVRLGGLVQLHNVTMTAAPVELAEQRISADAAGYQATTTASSLVLDAKRLDALPLARNFREITLLAPGATPAYYVGFDRDGINIGGATGYENTYFVDGINITSPIRGETSIDLPYNFIEQIQVRTGGSTAEDAQALGGVVNVVTPNGGNDFRSDVFGFISDDVLQTRARRVVGASQTGFRFHDIGGSVRGPVVRDRLWYFAAYNANYERRDFSYGFGAQSESRRQHLFAGKLTWRPGERTTVIVTAVGDPTRSDRLSYPPLVALPGIALNPEVVRQDLTAGGTAFSVRLFQFLTSRVLVDASVSHLTRVEEYAPPTPAGFEPVVSDAVTGSLYGGFGDRERYDASRRSARIDVSWELPSHAVKFGVQHEDLRNEMLLDLARNGAGGTITRVDVSTWLWHSAMVAGGRGANRTSSAFVQDAWQVTPGLQVNAGVRWSRQDILDLVGDSLHFRIRDGAQPRVGIVYRFGGNRSRVFASFGRVAQQIPTWFSQSYGLGAESLFVFLHDPRLDPRPDSLQYGIVYAPPPIDGRQLDGQTSDEWAIGYGRRVGSRTQLGARATHRSLRNTIQTGSHRDGRGGFWGNPGRGVLDQFPRATRTYDALDVTLERSGRPVEARVTYVLSRTRGNFPGQYSPDWRNGLPNLGPFFATPAQHVNGSGLLPNDRTHVFKIIAVHELRDRLTLGSSLLVASGTPLSEYGAIEGFGLPFRGFTRPRGSAGRTAAIWDLGVRVGYDVHASTSRASRARVIMDVQNIGSPRRAVDIDQLRFTCLDADGNQSCARAQYGQVTQYQPPMTARVGLELRF